MKNIVRKSSLSRLVLMALALVLALPFVTFADPKGQGKNKNKKRDVFVNGHDARDGRTDGRGPRRNRDRDRDWDNDDDDNDNDRQRRRDRRRDRDDDRDDRDRDYDRDRDGRYDNYGNSQLRQTALNAGYNQGIQEGRTDRSRGERFDYRDESDYRSASKDYNSRLGDRGQYQQFFRQGFANGYRDGYNGN